MKVKTIFGFVGFASLMLILNGCEHGEKKEHGHGHTSDEYAVEEDAVTFNVKRGISVPKSTAAFIGMTVQDVVEREVRKTLRFSAQICQIQSRPASPASTEILASGIVSGNDAKSLSADDSVAIQRSTSANVLRGKIKAVNPIPELGNNSFEVLLTIEDAAAPLKLGEHLEITAEIGKPANVSGVPGSALLRTVEGEFVYTVSGEHYVRTHVKTGVIDNDFVEITDGLFAGDQVVVRPVMTLWMAELQSLRGGKACADGH